MAQVQLAEGEVSNIADNRPRKLEDNQKLVEKKGGVYLVTTTTNSDGHEIVRESRVDSARDADAMAKGVTPWYATHLAEARRQAEADAAAEAEAEREKVRAEVRAELEAEAKETTGRKTSNRGSK